MYMNFVSILINHSVHNYLKKAVFMAVSQSLSNIRYHSDHYFLKALTYSEKGLLKLYHLLAMIMQNQQFLDN